MSLLNWCAAHFRERGIPAPRLDAEFLLAHVLGCTRMELYLQFDRPVSALELDALRPLVRARAQRMPVAYLTGRCGFWNLELEVGPGCLVPRPDTETLVEVARAALTTLRTEEAQTLRVLELGTGSGALALALCAELKGLCVVSCELSPLAMAYARRNRTRHAQLLAPRDNRLHLILGDGFSAIRPDFAPALIVANPPYIPRDLLPTLEPEVAQAEPALALAGGADGLDFYRRLLAHAAVHLPPGGHIALEIGHDQGEALRALAAAYPELTDVSLHADLAGRPRVFQALHA